MPRSSGEAPFDAPFLAPFDAPFDAPFLAPFLAPLPDPALVHYLHRARRRRAEDDVLPFNQGDGDPRKRRTGRLTASRPARLFALRRGRRSLAAASAAIAGPARLAASSAGAAT
jgi:hypothetical protein